MSSQGGRGSKIANLLSKKTTKIGRGRGHKLPILSQHSLWRHPSCPLSFVLKIRDIHLQSRKFLQILKISLHTFKTNPSKVIRVGGYSNYFLVLSCLNVVNGWPLRNVDKKSIERFHFVLLFYSNRKTREDTSGS